MITVGMNYKVKENKGELFESVFNKVLGVMNEIPGHQRSHLYKDTQDTSSYLIVSEWSDRKAFDGFIASDRFKNVANWGKEEVLAARPKHEVYETAADHRAGASHQAPPTAGGCPFKHG